MFDGKEVAMLPWEQSGVEYKTGEVCCDNCSRINICSSPFPGYITTQPTQHLAMHSMESWAPISDSVTPPSKEPFPASLHSGNPMLLSDEPAFFVNY